VFSSSIEDYLEEKLEKMQKEATTKAQQQMEEEQKQVQDTIDGGGSVNFQKVDSDGTSEAPTHEPESVTFD